MERITLQIWRSSGWERLGEASLDSNAGLMGSARFEYDTNYVGRYGEAKADGLHLSLSDQVSTLMAGSLFTVHREPMVNAVLRDIIPSGWARGRLCKALGLPRGAASDYALLSRCAHSPIGNLRVAPENRDRVVGPAFSREDLTRYQWRILDEVSCSSDWAGLGAGGDAPKLLVAEDAQGNLFLDGSEPLQGDFKRWVVKWPRGNRSIDREILRAEYAISRELGTGGMNCVEVEWTESADAGSLWVRRFDQEANGARHSVESIYSLMQMVGDGARLYHHKILETLLPLAENWDEFLCEYLFRDAINEIIANPDNHGRNQAVYRTDAGIRLTPAYDLAPMRLDPESVAKATVWNSQDCYAKIIDQYALNKESVRYSFRESIERAMCAASAAKAHCADEITRAGFLFKYPSMVYV